MDVISVERSLKKLNEEYELQTAFNGIEALEILNQKSNELGVLPDVILLDLNMPKMNGLEFLQTMRKDERFKNIKVFVMTTSGEEADRKSSEELGISGYLIKPLNFNNNSKRTDSMDGFFQFHIRKIFAAEADLDQM